MFEEAFIPGICLCSFHLLQLTLVLLFLQRSDLSFPNVYKSLFFLIVAHLALRIVMLCLDWNSPFPPLKPPSQIESASIVLARVCDVAGNQDVIFL